MKVYAFVPAKSSSERVYNKNTQFLSGERLFVRALRTLLKCKEIDEVFLDTDSKEMYEMVDYLPVKFMQRDKSLASNKTDGHQLLVNEVTAFPEADIYVQLLCTSPFILPSTIDEMIRKIKNSNYDSGVLMKKEKCYFWNNKYPEYNINHIPNSKDLPDTITESMGLYIAKKDLVLKEKKRYGGNILLHFGSPQELVDINSPQDLSFAKTIADGLLREENNFLRRIKPVLTSAACSDVIDNFNNATGELCGGVISGWKSNLMHKSILGRANTLKLRALKKDENPVGIYSALTSYEGIKENDIIIVENELKDFAYFGSLNAHLAIAAGAVGAIIDGATRDCEETQFLDFPVFAKKYTAKDVRNRATVDYINKPILIEKFIISPGDLLFVDSGGLVVIYPKYEKEIIGKVLEVYHNEKGIISDITANQSITEILSKRGCF